MMLSSSATAAVASRRSRAAEEDKRRVIEVTLPPVQPHLEFLQGQPVFTSLSEQRSTRGGRHVQPTMMMNNNKRSYELLSATVLSPLAAQVAARTTSHQLGSLAAQVAARMSGPPLVESPQKKSRTAAAETPSAVQARSSQLLRHPQATIVRVIPPSTQKKYVVNHSYADYSQVPVELGDPTTINNNEEDLNDLSFFQKLHHILNVEEYQKWIHWMPHGRAFRVAVPKFVQCLICPKYFGHQRFLTFLSQLNSYGFRHITQGRDRNSYYHECFLRGLPHLCKYMPKPRNARRKVPDPANEPDFYEISKRLPLPSDERPREATGSASSVDPSEQQQQLKTTGNAADDVVPASKVPPTSEKQSPARGCESPKKVMTAPLWAVRELAQPVSGNISSSTLRQQDDDKKPRVSNRRRGGEVTVPLCAVRELDAPVSNSSCATMPEMAKHKFSAASRHSDSSSTSELSSGSSEQGSTVYSSDLLSNSTGEDNESLSERKFHSAVADGATVSAACASLQEASAVNLFDLPSPSLLRQSPLVQGYIRQFRPGHINSIAIVAAAFCSVELGECARHRNLRYKTG